MQSLKNEQTLEQFFEPLYVDNTKLLGYTIVDTTICTTSRYLE